MGRKELGLAKGRAQGTAGQRTLGVGVARSESTPHGEVAGSGFKVQLRLGLAVQPGPCLTGLFARLYTSRERNKTIFKVTRPLNSLLHFQNPESLKTANVFITLAAEPAQGGCGALGEKHN